MVAVNRQEEVSEMTTSRPSLAPAGVVRCAALRRTLIMVCVMGLLAALTVTRAGAASSRNPYPRDDKLRLQDVQMLGTHNSYHLRPARTLAPAEPADYEHPPLDVQLSQQGVRSLELDAYNAPTLPVFHSIIVDDRSTCPTTAACLATIKSWSAANPGHVPLVLFIEPKALPTDPNPGIQTIINNYDAEHNLANWDAASLERLDATVRHGLGRKLITPDEVRGKHVTLRGAILSGGWPTLAKTRGRVLVVLAPSDPIRDLYLTGAPSLERRAMFVPSHPDEPSAAVMKSDAPQPAQFPSLERQHFLVKTAADAEAREARANDVTRATIALASGAHIVSTDYPVADPTIGPYVVDLPGTGVVRCNPVTASKWCRDADLENPRGLRKH
jgi:Phosphoinositide phospholipase C, Ca2+-dependent